MFNNRRVLTNQMQLFFTHRAELMLRIVNQNCIFQVQAPGAWIEVITGEQHPLIINPHSLKVIAVVVIFPQTNDQLVSINIILQSAEEAAEVDFIQIGEGADNLKRLIFRNIEVIRSFIANDNLYLLPATQ